MRRLAVVPVLAVLLACTMSACGAGGGAASKTGMSPAAVGTSTGDTGDTCTIGASDGDARVTVTGKGSYGTCTELITAFGHSGTFWSKNPADPAAASSTVCVMTQTSHSVEVRDSGGQSTGRSICASLAGARWEEDVEAEGAIRRNVDKQNGIAAVVEQTALVESWPASFDRIAQSVRAAADLSQELEDIDDAYAELKAETDPDYRCTQADFVATAADYGNTAMEYLAGEVDALEAAVRSSYNDAGVLMSLLDDTGGGVQADAAMAAIERMQDAERNTIEDVNGSIDTANATNLRIHAWVGKANTLGHCQAEAEPATKLKHRSPEGLLGDALGMD